MTVCSVSNQMLSKIEEGRGIEKKGRRHLQKKGETEANSFLTFPQKGEERKLDYFLGNGI